MGVSQGETNRLDDPEQGISLVEVLIAMMIFAMIAVGVAYSLTSMMSQVRDTRAREVATNLAAQEIDLARATGAVMGLLDSSYSPTTVNGVTFQVQRTTHWVTDGLNSGACGVGTGGSTGALKYKSVHVEVTWAGAGSSARTVSTDTLIAPKSPVSSASAGTILVSVRNAAGAGIPGVTIATTPSTSPAPSATDAQGCIYIPNVPPGTYAVQITTPSYVDAQQVKPPVVSSITVSAGKSGTASFSADLQTPLTVSYGTFFTPQNLDTSFLHAVDPVFISASATAVNTRVFQLFPFVENYTVLAGKYRASNAGTLGCLSPNPAEWPAGVVAGKSLAAGVAPPGVRPGPSASTSVPMGSLSVAYTAVDGLTAVSQTTPQAGTGDPGCAALTMTYAFGNVLKAGTVNISLPYGTWKLYRGTTTLTQITSGIAAVPGTQAEVAAGLVTLDPRAVSP
jgi:type II secretory pathway pseudopilin PulG